MAKSEWGVFLGSRDTPQAAESLKRELARKTPSSMELHIKRLILSTRKHVYAVYVHDKQPNDQ